MVGLFDTLFLSPPLHHTHYLCCPGNSIRPGHCLVWIYPTILFNYCPDLILTYPHKPPEPPVTPAAPSTVFAYCLPDSVSLSPIPLNPSLGDASGPEQPGRARVSKKTIENGLEANNKTNNMGIRKVDKTPNLGPGGFASSGKQRQNSFREKAVQSTCEEFDVLGSV